jgi:cytochrome P450
MTDTVTPTSGNQTDIPDYPFSRNMKCPFNPPPEVVDRAAHSPVERVRIWNGSAPWHVTGNAELRQLATDSRVSVNEHLEGYPHWDEGMAGSVEHRPRTIVTLDGEEHATMRRLATRSFSFKKVNALRPTIQQVVDEQIDRMLAGPKPVDLVQALALPVPSRMIAGLLGVPYEDHEFFEAAANKGADSTSTPEEKMENVITLITYMSKMLEEKLAGPPDDDPDRGVLADYAEYVRAGDIALDQASLMLIVLLVAGHETSANMIGLGVLAAMQNPDQLAILRDTDDPQVIANAVEELLRYLSIVHRSQRRIATDDIEVGGVTIKAGEGILLDVSGANWDARVFEEPERLDLGRDASQHLAFGYGPHGCVGQQLARAELQIVFGTLFKRIPDLKLAIPFEGAPFTPERLAYGVSSLPVTW